MITDDELRQIMPNCWDPKSKYSTVAENDKQWPNAAAKRAAYLPFLQQAMEEFEINTYLRKAAFLAQLAHESGELKYMEELASGEKYEGNIENLGNTQKGDGRRFKGRGPIQLTGRANYEKYGEKLDLDLVNNPTIAATKEVGFRIAGQFWKDHGLNELADKGTQIVDVTRTRKGGGKFVEKHPAFDAITFRINGGFNGKDERIKYYERGKKVLSKGDSADATAAAPATAEEPSSAGQAPAYPGAALRQGSKGPDVQTMQQRLSDLGYSLGVDGNFGPGTAKAVIAFQQKNSLGNDGVVGPNTWAALWAAGSAAAGA